MLHRIYESEAKDLDRWTDSPAEVSKDDWRDYLGYPKYVLGPALASPKCILYVHGCLTGMLFKQI